MPNSAEKMTNITEAKSSLSRLVERALKGKRVVISRAGKPVVMLVPYQEDTSPRILGGSWEGRVTVSEDFDELPLSLQRAFEGDDELAP